MVNSNEFSIILLQNSVIVQRTFILSIFRSRRSWRHLEKWTKRHIKRNSVARFSTLLHRTMWFSRRFEPLHELGHSLLRRHPCYLIDLGSFSVHTGTIEKEKTKWLFSPLNFLHPLCYSFLRDDVFFCLLEGRIRGFLFSWISCLFLSGRVPCWIDYYFTVT